LAEIGSPFDRHPQNFAVIGIRFAEIGIGLADVGKILPQSAKVWRTSVPGVFKSCF